MNEREFRRLAFKEIAEKYSGKNKKEWGKKTAIAKSLGLTRAAICLWEKNGVPGSRIPYFRLKFPDLEIWKNTR